MPGKEHRVSGDGDEMPAGSNFLPGEADDLPRDGDAVFSDWSSANRLPGPDHVLPVNGDAMPAASNLLSRNRHRMPSHRNEMSGEANGLSAGGNAMRFSDSAGADGVSSDRNNVPAG